MASKERRAPKPKKPSVKDVRLLPAEQSDEESDSAPQNRRSLFMENELVKKPFKCHLYLPEPIPKTPMLIFTHGAGGTLSAEAVLNFCTGYSSSQPVLTFQGSVNLKARTKSFHACIYDYDYGQWILRAGRPADTVVEKKLLLGGRSMGARAAVIAATEHLASLDDKERAELSIQLILVSYPLLGPREDLRDQILLDLPKSVRILFISGDEDAMCPIDTLNETRDKLTARSQLVVVTDANHGMNVVPASRTQRVGEETGRWAARWVEGGMVEDEVFIDELEGEEEWK